MLAGSLRERLVKPFQDNERLLMLCTAQFVFMMGAGVVVPVLPRFAQSFGVSATMVGVVISVFGLARVFTNAPSGFLSQRYGRRMVLVGGSLITVIASFLCGTAGDFWQLVAFRFLAGAGSGMFSTGAMIYLTDISTPANRGRMMSAYQGSLLVGTSFGPAVGGFIAALFDDRAAFFAIMVLALGCAFWCGLRLPETVAKGGSMVREHWIGQQPEHNRSVNPWSILVDGNFLLIGFVTFAIFFTRTGAQFSIVPLMAYNTLGIGPAELGFALTIISVLNFVGVPLSGMAADKLGRKAAIVPGCLLAGVGLLMFTVGSTYALFLLASVVHGLGKGLGGVAPAAYAADLAPEGMEGVTMGLYRTLADLGYVLGPPLLGWIADSAGFGWSIGFAAGLLFVGPLLFGLFARETLSRRRAAEPGLGTSSN